MRYYINGTQVSSNEAKNLTFSGYVAQGGDPAEFRAVWANQADSEEARELLNEWSGYTVEIFTDEGDEELDD